MTYDAFLAWCIDVSREDRSKFVSELPMRLNSLLNERQPSRRCTSSRSKTPKGREKGALKMALKSARKDLTKSSSRA